MFKTPLRKLIAVLLQHDVSAYIKVITIRGSGSQYLELGETV